MQLLHRLVDRIESADRLDPVAERVQQLVEPIRSHRRLHDALTGRWLGHSVHPAIVVVPIGCWTGAAILDATSPGSVAARRLIGAGVAVAGPAALTGSADWVDTSGAERRVGLIHALSNDLAITAFALSWIARRRGATWVGVGFTGIGLGAVGLGGFLGGHLAYVRGVSVNTTAFQSGPEQWQRLTRASDLVDGAATALDLDGLALVAVRRGERVHVLEDRCTHRGGPLSDGEVVNGCIECPWHSSRFALADGDVRRGPASVPQPVYETRVVDGWVEVRRDEPGALRAEPVGARHETDAEMDGLGSDRAPHFAG